VSADAIQTVLVSAVALIAAAVLIWRIASPYFTKATTSAPCAKCASGDKCAPAQPQPQVIQIQRRA
jgi:hypothetical protein